MPSTSTSCIPSSEAAWQPGKQCTVQTGTQPVAHDTNAQLPRHNAHSATRGAEDATYIPVSREQCATGHSSTRCTHTAGALLAHCSTVAAAHCTPSNGLRRYSRTQAQASSGHAIGSITVAVQCSAVQRSAVQLQRSAAQCSAAQCSAAITSVLAASGVSAGTFCTMNDAPTCIGREPRLDWTGLDWMSVRCYAAPCHAVPRQCCTAVSACRVF
jgi:hypothetical protein